MEFWLTKLLTSWLNPLGLALALLVLLTLAQILMGRWRTGFVLVLVTGGLWLAATPRASGWLLWTLERDFPEQAMDATATADALVLLGGALQPSRTSTGSPNLHEASDRILHALRLYRAEKAPRVVISGGQWPWHDAPKTEAEVIAELLVEWGVPAEAILVETDSANTYENALHTKPLLEEHGIERVLLVTSAAHMPRALAVFSRAGIKAIPAAIDHHGTETRGDALLDWMPDAYQLYLTSLAVKEYVGMAWYRWKGWA